MNALLQRIRAKGYWQTIIRPVEERDDRVTISPRVIDAIRAASVQLRGWDLPHVDYNSSPQIELDSIGQDIAWEHFQEIWRVFKSGQFLHVAGMRHDWGAPRQLAIMEDDPGDAPILGIGDAVFRFTEIAMFSSAYSRSILKGEPSRAFVEVGGLRGRHLVVDDPGRAGWPEQRVATTDRPFPTILDLSVGMDKDSLASWARDASRGLYGLFGLEIGDVVIEDWQSKIKNW